MEISLGRRRCHRTSSPHHSQSSYTLSNISSSWRTTEVTLHANIIENVKYAGIQGFCIGFLSATALACSKSEEDVGILGAVALRLAFFTSGILYWSFRGSGWGVR